jgi:hypothetical protein
MDCSTRAFCEKACITNILRIRSYAKHAAWGAIDLAFRIHLADDLHVFILQRKAIPFPGYDARRLCLSSSSFRCLVSSHALGKWSDWARLHLGRRKSLLDMQAHIDGVDEGCLPFATGPCLLMTRAL